MKTLLSLLSAGLRRATPLCAGCILLASSAAAQSADTIVEYRLKAAYLYNFTKFIEWPPPAFSADGSPFIIGVVDPSGEAARVIRDALRSKTTSSGREIEVRHLAVLNASAAECHQLFLTRASNLTPSAVRAALRGAPVLTVGETADFAERGGAIALVVSGDAVKCEVNLAGAERSGVKLSGRLASVARLVRETAPP